MSMYVNAIFLFIIQLEVIMEKQLDNREVTEQDTVLLPGVSEYRKNIQDCINKLGEVLNELTVRESLDDPDTLG